MTLPLLVPPVAESADLRRLSGLERAAALMLALGPDHGAPIWARLTDDEVRELSGAMANLGTVSAGLVEQLIGQFSTQVSNVSSLHGSYETTENLLVAMLPKERVSGIMEEIRGPAGRTMWDKLGNVHEEVLAAYLRNEYPQTVAVVLHKIRADHAARVLSQLPQDFAMEVVMRMLRLDTVQKEVLDKVEATLRNEFMANLARTTRRDAHETMAEIFNHLDRATEERFMAALEEHNFDAAERIRTLMFTFEDLVMLDPAGIQTLMRRVDKHLLALALKGASEPLKDMFFANMSERAGRILRDDIEAMGPVRLRDVEDAQQTMVQTAKLLADSGEININDVRASDDDELVY